MPSDHIQDKLRSLLESQHRIVLLDRYFPEISTSYVIVDNEGGSYESARHLIGQTGKTSLYYDFCKTTSWKAAEVYPGYKRA